MGNRVCVILEAAYHRILDTIMYWGNELTKQSGETAAEARAVDYVTPTETNDTESDPTRDDRDV